MIPLTTSNPLQPQVDELEANLGTTAQTTVTEHNAKPEDDPQAKQKADVKKRNDEFRTRIETTKNYRRKLIANWTSNVDYRRGKPFTSQTDEDQIAVNLDWILTKSKWSALFSQVPRARVTHGVDTLPKNSPWAAKFESMLNDYLVEGGIEATMEEIGPDCINAAGIGVALVSYESITEDRPVPKIDPSTLSPEQQAEFAQSQTVDGQPVEMEMVPTPVDKRYLIQRISPADFLWPLNFTGSNFNNAPWIGRSGRITWADAVKKFKLTEADKEKVIGEDKPSSLDKLTHDTERERSDADAQVNFDELFYKDYQFDEESKSFSTIHHLVFIHGKEDPVVDEPWKGQKVDQDGTVIGPKKYPVQVLTLDYVTDEAIPPSNSATARPQVNEINKGRTQQMHQRERSLPVRWFDVNRVDPAIQQGLMRGTWQAMIPVQGEGSRVIGEVARATMPQENFMFDKVARGDAYEEWGIGQLAKQDEDDNTDEDQNKSPLNNPLGRERARVASFFVGIAEVLGGLMCLYEDPQAFGEGFDAAVCKKLCYSILADSTVLLTTSQRLARLNAFVNTYAKSGWINIEPVLAEIATLTGLDPNIVVKAPEPKPPVEPNISLRLTGVEDMLNPLALAFLIKSGQAPDPDLIEKAKQLIQQAVVPPQVEQAEQQGQVPGLIPGQQDAPSGSPLPPGLPPGVGGPLPPPQQGPLPGGPTPPPPPPRMGEAHPRWTTMPALDKRTESGGNQ